MRNFSKCKRIVIKIGTNTLGKEGSIDKEFMTNMAAQVKQLVSRGLQVVIVTSGSIGMGAGHLGLNRRVKGVKMRQACAAVGQPLLMRVYSETFRTYGLSVAQVLLTSMVLSNRKSYLNLRNAVETLLNLGVIPVINENDSVSTDEIGSSFGDNDKLSALVASKIDAELLIMLSDIDALYEEDPRMNPEAKAIPVVMEITREIEQNAGGSGSTHSTGGMATKIAAARILHNTGCKMVLVNGKKESIILKAVGGENVGTLFLPRRKLSNRLRWILYSSPGGVIRVDEGALAALRNNKSLLPSGIKAVEGVFDAGSVIAINGEARAVTAFSSDELKLIAGKHSREIEQILGEGRRDVVATPEDIIFLDS